MAVCLGMGQYWSEKLVSEHPTTDLVHDWLYSVLTNRRRINQGRIFVTISYGASHRNWLLEGCTLKCTARWLYQISSVHLRHSPAIGCSRQLLRHLSPSMAQGDETLIGSISFFLSCISFQQHQTPRGWWLLAVLLKTVLFWFSILWVVASCQGICSGVFFSLRFGDTIKTPGSLNCNTFRFTVIWGFKF